MNEQKCNATWNDTEWTRYWGVDADDCEDDYETEDIDDDDYDCFDEAERETMLGNILHPTTYEI